MHKTQWTGASLAAGVALTAAASAGAKDMTYKASIDVRPGKHADVCGQRELNEPPCYIRGSVFLDKNRDGRLSRNEPGIDGVLVSNGREVVRTNSDGEYRLPVYEQPGGTTIFITKPAAYDVPLNELNIPQFSYHHIPAGSPAMRFGGLPASGPLPKAINFPLIRGEYKERFRAVISGDTQPYSNNEIGYVRDTLVKDMVADGTDKIEFLIIEGDILGDDLGLYPRMKEVLQPANVPVYWVPGNHDLDFDAPNDEHSYDTFRREWGPAYHSFDIGKVHFVVLDNVRYPCTAADNADGRHAFCTGANPAYTGVVTPAHMEWLKNDLEATPKDKLIVLNMHIPLISYIDNTSSQHQVYNTAEIYKLLEGRPSLALSGHTHTLEQIRPGELFAGWQTAFTKPLGPSPIPQIVTGATCGGWWSGDFDDQGIPQAWDRVGSPRGHLLFEFDGNTYKDKFRATGKPRERQMSLSFLSPTFTAWYDALAGWLATPAATRPEVTPVGINDLPDPSIVTTSDLDGGTYLVANVWNGSRDSEVTVEFDRDGEVMELERVQAGDGEGFVEFLDPFALERQLYVLRYAIRSDSGNARAQGFELYRGSHFTADPQPTTTGLTTHSNHTWHIPLPDLGPGAHTARVKTVDAHGQVFQEVIAFEIRDERPPPFFRSEVFE
jgi:calcineurin-like phosphoesterase family protein